MNQYFAISPNNLLTLSSGKNKPPKTKTKGKELKANPAPNQSTLGELGVKKTKVLGVGG